MLAVLTLIKQMNMNEATNGKLTKTPVLTTLKTSTSLVNKVAKELKETPKITAKETPATNPIWKSTCKKK